MRDPRSDKPPSARVRLLGGPAALTPVAVMTFLMTSSILLSAGCASKQEVKTKQRRQQTEHFQCLPDRWAEPPQEIGQTPPDSAPNARDIDPFLEPNSKLQD